MSFTLCVCLVFLFTTQIECCECCVCFECFTQRTCSFISNVVGCLLCCVVSHLNNIMSFTLCLCLVLLTTQIDCCQWNMNIQHPHNNTHSFFTNPVSCQLCCSCHWTQKHSNLHHVCSHTNQIHFSAPSAFLILQFCCKK